VLAFESDVTKGHWEESGEEVLLLFACDAGRLTGKSDLFKINTIGIGLPSGKEVFSKSKSLQF
jgi:hypothetical protein